MNNDSYFTYENVDRNSCVFNTNGRASAAHLYAILGDNSVIISGNGPWVHCGFEPHNDNFWFETCNQESTMRYYIDAFKNNSHNIIQSNPHTKSAKCDNNDCIIYIDIGMIEMDIKCPDGYGCRIHWYGSV